MSEDPPIRKSFTTVINKEFTWYIVARILFIGGLRMTPVLFGWRLYQVTGSKLSLGILGLSEVIPALALALPAGVRVDRSNKHKLLSICMALYLLAALGLLLITSPWMEETLPVIWLNGEFMGLFLERGSSGPSVGQHLIRSLRNWSPPLLLFRAISVNSMVWLIAATAGPVLAGLIMGYTNVTIAFALVCILIAISLVIFRKISPKPISWQQGNSKTWEAVKEGLNFVFSKKALLGAMTLDMFAVLFGGATALLPVFAADILKVGPQGLGWLVAATYLGNFIAIAGLTWKPLKGKQGSTLLYMVGGFGVCVLLFAMSKNFWLSFAALFISGLFDGVSVIIRGTIVQLFVPDEMRGRVSSVNSIFINSSNELGQFESGVAASLLGTVPSVIFGGCMTLLVVIATWLKAPTLRKFEY